MLSSVVIWHRGMSVVGCDMHWGMGVVDCDMVGRDSVIVSYDVAGGDRRRTQLCRGIGGWRHRSRQAWSSVVTWRVGIGVVVHCDVAGGDWRGRPL